MCEERRNKVTMIGALLGGGMISVIIFCALVIGMNYADDLRMFAAMFLGYFYCWFLTYVEKEYEAKKVKKR